MRTTIFFLVILLSGNQLSSSSPLPQEEDNNQVEKDNVEADPSNDNEIKETQPNEIVEEKVTEPAVESDNEKVIEDAVNDETNSVKSEEDDNVDHSSHEVENHDEDPEENTGDAEESKEKNDAKEDQAEPEQTTTLPINHEDTEDIELEIVGTLKPNPEPQTAEAVTEPELVTLETSTSDVKNLQNFDSIKTWRTDLRYRVHQVQTDVEAERKDTSILNIPKIIALKAKNDHLIKMGRDLEDLNKYSDTNAGKAKAFLEIHESTLIFLGNDRGFLIRFHVDKCSYNGNAFKCLQEK